MSSELQLIKSADFNGLTLDCYVKPEQQDIGNFWATREQIGQLLGYSDPTKAIGNLHERNKERLDKFSTNLTLRKVEGRREVVREIIVYNFKGLLEVCRYSQQPRADAVIDWLWDVADEIRRTGSYSIKTATDETVTPNLINSAAAVFKLSGIEDNQLVLAVDKYFRSRTGHSALEAAGIQLVAPSQTQLLNSTEIGKHFGLSARQINNILIAEGYQRRLENGKYEPTELGEAYAVMLDTGKRHSDGTPVRQLKWESTIVHALETVLEATA